MGGSSNGVLLLLLAAAGVFAIGAVTLLITKSYIQKETRDDYEDLLVQDDSAEPQSTLMQDSVMVHDVAF
ncbi:putative transmembrane protein [Gregarina niphandrodes]|uniref:Transmembrane protein n=1 Tax=Gregarina niphandrodes TaxID=110365 RepID=A0A023AYN9_GRENI|nr:putative transmembrane protein [Gregarina niphandrodes]EZG43781.1 putative transmembrane protein [Gregarina niphandrodes]|eukprot:XP_011134608.1 putative transmembrane protein [Gregarina niphandrodes]